MHKFIIVGHPQSGYQEVENLLHECGMGKANPSRREGLLPAQISEMLRQAHGTPALAALNAPEQVEQIGTAPVWHGMAMDLMLGNLDQRFWGWSDPGAIHLLEYWKQLDPTINFVFVYADPQSALVGPGADDALAVEAKLANWQAFNAAMLHFYNRNPKRSVLVQAEQVRHSVRAYLQQLRTQLNAPLQEPPAHLLPAHEDGEAKPASAGAEAAAAGEGTGSELVVQEAGAVPSLSGKGINSATDESALSRFVAGHCVAQHPSVVQLYDELQAVANLPFELGMLAAPADAAWVALQIKTRRAELQRAALREQEDQLAALQQRADAQRLDLERVGKDVEGKQQLLASSERRIGELSAEMERLRGELAGHADTKEENERLLNQLHQIQEELERLFHARTDNEKALALAKSSEGALRERLDVLQAEEAKLKDALAKKTTEQEETLDENELLLTQLHAVQEELERIFLEKEDLKKTLSAAKDSERIALDKLKSAERAEKAGANRLAELKRELEALRGVEAKLKAAEKAEKAGVSRLAALKRDVEALRAQEAKLKGAVEKKTAEQQKTQNENRRLLSQLQVVQEELERRHAEIQHLKKTTIPRDPPLYGAAERVKQQLTYRLGATMIQKSKSVGGWLSMPFALIGATRKFRTEQRAMGGKKLPPIFKYKDADQAERVKQHLSYRVGTVLLRNVKSPLGWVRLPFALRREIKAFRLERQKGTMND